ncbi:MAG: DUF4214 domain-containing protein [Burkholderiales bacterium]|nr:DUF4214 domain-containing protein [Burkholderiales bacterium]
MPKLSDIKSNHLSGWTHIDALLDTGPGWNWLTPQRKTISYSFSVAAGLDPKSAGISSAVTAFSTAQQAATIKLLNYVTQITGIQFAQTNDGSTADVHFGNADITDKASAGLTQWNYNYFYDGQQNVTSYVAQAYVYVDNAESGNRYLNPQSGNYAYELLLHEIGHVLGLKHPFSDGVTLPANLDNTNNTVMSYQQIGLHSEFSPFDLAALAWLYGGDGLGGNYGVGSPGEYLIATSGNDVIKGSAGGDVLDGLAGADQVVYSGKRSAYQIKRGADDITVLEGQALDHLRQIEKIQFADMSVNLEIQSLAKTIASTDLQRIEELYVAFFNRVPDADGLAYWITQFKQGASVAQLAESFYQAGLLFPQLTGYRADMSHADFVNTVYRNVLGRQDGADAGGLAYWTGGLANGSETHGSLVANIVFAAHGFKKDATWGWVADLLDNKITVAYLFSVSAGLNYNTPEESIDMGMKIAAKVTPTSINDAITLIGISVEQLSALQI